MRILIVDDHEAVRRGLLDLLTSRADWTVCGEAVDGVEAIEKAKSLRPDLVLMDISMPRMNGLDATRILRRDLPDSRVVIVSQNDPNLTRFQVKEVDAAAYVAKGSLAEELLPTIDNLFPRLETVTSADSPLLPRQSPPQHWLAGSGELRQLIREYDWSQTPLGPIEQWPQVLKTAVTLMINSRQAMWLGWGPEITVLYNDAYISVLGISKHPHALGRPAKEVWKEVWDICGPLAEKVYENGEATFIDDVRFFMNRGDFKEEIYVSFSYSPIHDEAGNVAGLFCPNTETTAKILNARRLLTLSELAVSALVEKSTETACVSSFATIAKNRDDIPFAQLYLIDADSRHARLEQTTGASADIIRMSPQIIDISQESEALRFWKLDDVFTTSQAQIVSLCQLEVVPLGPAGQRVSEAIVLPLTSPGQDRPVGIFIAGISPARKLDAEYRTFYDLVAGQIATALQNARAAEDERKRAEALVEIDRAKTAFFSNVSHEFRTPLTLMLGPIEDLLAKSHTDLSPSAKGQLELVNRNGARLLRLVNTLLDFSRLEAGRMQAIYQATDLPRFTLELASVFRAATERAGLRLQLNCPQLSEPVFVDRGMWEKIVLNLISNAFKFTFDGQIGVSLTQLSDHVELRVSDTGVGIPEEELPRLFDRFHRIENTRSRTHEGSGIGLALVQELVKLHGGSIRVLSKLGLGTTFIVSIPLGSSHLNPERVGGHRTLASTAVGAVPFVEEALRWLPEPATLEETDELPITRELIPVPCPTDSNDPGNSRPRILVADDNADMRQYISRLLGERYRVQAVADGRAALKAVKESAPDLILSDVMMPILDGFGLLRELRSDPVTRTIPIVLLSARAGEESRVEGLEKGADDYLVKPFSARELLARVQTHIELARVRKENEESLRQRNAQFESLLNEAPMGVYLIDADFSIRQVNPTALPVFGGIPDLIGRDFNEVLHILWPESIADEIAGRFRHTLETGETYVEPERSGSRLDREVTEIYDWRIGRIPLPDGRNGVVCYFRDISQQVRARQAIAESEERLSRALAAGELGAWEMDLGSRAIWRTTRHDQIFGYDTLQPEWSYEKFLQHVLPEDRAKADHQFHQAITSAGDLNLNCRIQRADGSTGWIWMQARLTQESESKPALLKGMIRDITERKRTEETLQRNRERFEMVAEAAQVGFWFCDLPFDKLLWDDRVKEHFGLPPEAEVTIHTFYERIHPEDRERTRKAIEDSIENHRQYDIEYRTVSPDGQEKWIRAIGRGFYDPSGKPVRFDGVSMETTERRQAELALRQMTGEAIAATAKFRAVFDQTSVFAGIMTLDGIVVDANQLCLDFCGYRAEEIIGRPFWDTGWWRGSPEVQAKIRSGTAQAAAGTPYREVLTYLCADGSERVVEFALHPIRNHKGEILFLHPTGVDITDLKLAQDKYRRLAESLDVEVQDRTRELEERNRDVLKQSEQLRELSHRLIQIQDNERRHIARELHDSAGQILTALGMNLAKLSNFAKRESPQILKDVEEGQKFVKELSQEIRTTSYLLHPPLLDENGLADALIWYVQGLKERSGLDVSVSISPDFGRLAREMELAIFRIIQECLTNVHRHSGSKVATIRVNRDDQTVSVEINDNGKGIPPDKLAQLQSHGGGVGIRGMRERVFQLGGEMKIQSETSGTSVAIILPLDVAVTAKTLSSVQ